MCGFAKLAHKPNGFGHSFQSRIKGQKEFFDRPKLLQKVVKILQQTSKAGSQNSELNSAEFHFEPINCKTPNCEKEKSKSNEQDQNVSQPNDNEKSTNVNEQSKPTKQEENISKSTNENEQSKSTKQEEKSTSSNNEATDLVHFSRNIRDLVDSYRRTALNVSMEGLCMSHPTAIW